MLVTKLLTHITKFVIHVTKFVTKNFCADRKKYLLKSKKIKGEKKKYIRAKQPHFTLSPSRGARKNAFMPVLREKSRKRVAISVFFCVILPPKHEFCAIKGDFL